MLGSLQTSLGWLAKQAGSMKNNQLILLLLLKGDCSPYSSLLAI
jgi:hypothetical protein